MKLRQLTVENYRGIREVAWKVDGSLVALVGSGDSTKSTLLDAIECCLTGRQFISFQSADFYKSSLDHEIKITAIVGELADELLSDALFGLDLKGWSVEGTVVDEPSDDAEPVVEIRLTVASDLEAAWNVISARFPEGRRVSARHRSMLGMVRLGTEIDRHFTWGRGSMLASLTDPDESGKALAQAATEAQSAVASADLAVLRRVASRTQQEAETIGARFSGDLEPALDPRSIESQTSSLVLVQKDSAPLRLAGYGTRKLTSLALEGLSLNPSSILLIDEVEVGLEPHRLRHLLSVLGQRVAGSGQVFLTTHSSISVVEIPSSNISVVRSDKGETKVHQVGDSLQDLCRRHPESLLARKVVVCEGPTEVGVVRGLRTLWASRHNGRPISHKGVDIVDGKGRTSAPPIALKLKALGFDVAVLADSDASLEPPASELEQEGIQVFQWPNMMATEDAIFSVAPSLMVRNLLGIASSHRAEITVRDDINYFTDTDLKIEELDDVLIEDRLPKLRPSLGRAAKERSWFKRTDKGEQVGAEIANNMSALHGSDLEQIVSRLESWIYDD